MASYRIPFNRPTSAPDAPACLSEALARGPISGDGPFTRRCRDLLKAELGVADALLTPSGTHALEMAALLLDLQPGDEVVLPSFTFVSTANAFVLRGAHPVFVDVRPDTLNLDERLIEAAITGRTRAIVAVHYAGVACEMDAIMEIAARHSLLVIEDAAQGVNATYKGRYLGTIGHLGAYSFHETKNFISGEGGALAVNDPRFIKRAEIIREKGTDRAKFFRGEVDKYTWVDLGSSYLPSEIIAAFLYAQLEEADLITRKRRAIFDRYHQAFAPLRERGVVRTLSCPDHCHHNSHMFYLILPSQAIRDGLIQHLKSKNIHSVFHYIPLHTSPMGRRMGYSEGDLPLTEDLSPRLLRLPCYFDLTESDQQRVVDETCRFLETVK